MLINPRSRSDPNAPRANIKSGITFRGRSIRFREEKLEIVVEIGTPEQKELVSQEFRTVIEAAQSLDPPLNLTRIIVAADFEDTVNKIEGTTSYNSEKASDSSKVDVIAKINKDGDGYAIILSLQLYSSLYDSQNRLCTIFHEFFHILNKRDFPPLPKDSYIKWLYFYNIYNYYDEYVADRKAYRLCEYLFPEKSQIWLDWMQIESIGYVEVINNPFYYNFIRKEIDLFRRHADLKKFEEQTHAYFDVVSIIICHAFALFHQYPEKINESDLHTSKFVNEKTFALMNFFKVKYESKSFDLSDGLDMIIDFMTNFGVKYEQRGEKEGYTYVLDI